ncbi:hypothetical protein KCH_77120 [Kitasatospora cheerisanensis KCTC 2395]|uniref:Uncharacterized protein n=1 Tax=Kitasatospora cheerisanensis KCTC 2395 TaxID=1348663 RepID=A0A066YRK0_9ACTN|nr:hypothetical protein KCH_77120 [Kitasatospora cheerisanensis KCTC 2395]
MTGRVWAKCPRRPGQRPRSRAGGGQPPGPACTLVTVRSSPRERGSAALRPAAANLAVVVPA